MTPFKLIYRFLLRMRYPVSLPEEVAEDLGISVSDSWSFDSFVGELVSPACRPTRLKKYMPRDQAEAAFHGALRKERFAHNTLFSYYFNEGWMEFSLLFDEQSRLRRLYLQHRKISTQEAVEITLVQVED